MELHTDDTEVEVYDNLRGEGNCCDENAPTGLYPEGPVIHVLYSDEKQARFQNMSLVSDAVITMKY